MSLGQLVNPNLVGPAGPTGATGPQGPAGADTTCGSATLNFGTAPGSQFASVVVTGQTSILSTSSIVAYVMASDYTVDNNALIHQIAPVQLTAGYITPGSGFTVFAYSQWNLSNTFMVRWSWT
jgi:hypothetical protein